MKFNYRDAPYTFQEYWTKYPEGYTIFETLLDWLQRTNDLIDHTNSLTNNVNNMRNELDTFYEMVKPELLQYAIQLVDDMKAAGDFDDILLTVVADQLELRDQRIDELEDRVDNIKFTRHNNLVHLRNRGRIFVDYDYNNHSYGAMSGSEYVPSIDTYFVVGRPRLDSMGSNSKLLAINGSTGEILNSYIDTFGHGNSIAVLDAGDGLFDVYVCVWSDANGVTGRIHKYVYNANLQVFVTQSNFTTENIFGAIWSFAGELYGREVDTKVIYKFNDLGETEYQGTLSGDDSVLLSSSSTSQGTVMDDRYIYWMFYATSHLRLYNRETFEFERVINLGNTLNYGFTGEVEDLTIVDGLLYINSYHLLSITEKKAVWQFNVTSLDSGVETNIWREVTLRPWTRTAIAVDNTQFHFEPLGSSTNKPFTSIQEVINTFSTVRDKLSITVTGGSEYVEDLILNNDCTIILNLSNASLKGNITVNRGTLEIRTGTLLTDEGQNIQVNDARLILNNVVTNTHERIKGNGFAEVVIKNCTLNSFDSFSVQVDTGVLRENGVNTWTKGIRFTSYSVGFIKATTPHSKQADTFVMLTT